MTTCNGALYLRDQLDSFKNQVRLPDELIVCDDGSTDETLTILKEFKHTAPFDMTVIQNENNIGYTKNFEQAMLNCSGDLIFFSDQDDVWFSSKIVVVAKTFQDNPDILLVIHDGDLVDKNLISSGVTKLEQVIAGYGYKNYHVSLMAS